ncbi:MAG: hypothetical protein WAP03_19285 [Methylorubrum rhodinum]|uniref:hypothetical protein n=1 Tax=Methylorubrum rhodinum TaxID=29428 RepID=UPI003BB15F54
MIPAPAKRLLDFIASYEAPRGYDTVYGNRMRDMPRPLTSMSLADVIISGPSRTKKFGSSACGRYQFMTATLKDLRKSLGLTGGERFDAAFQDRLGYALLKRRGVDRFLAGGMSVTEFALQIAKEWASFPVLAAVQGQHRRVQRGQSFYVGDGLNKALVPADRVEQFLHELLAGVAAAEPVIVAPRVDTIVPVAAEKLPWWARLFGRRDPRAPASDIADRVLSPIRPGLKSNGSPALWDVQKALRDRNYYTKGFLDGLDGPLTQSAVAQARKDNGLGDGGVDDAFLRALPTMPLRPVSAERAQIGFGGAAAHAPEVFNPLKWVATLGAGAAGFGGADSTGLLDTIKSSADRVNDVAGSAQSAIGFVAGAVGFVVEHKGILLVAGGLYLVFWAGGKALDAWIKVRQAFF